MKMKHALAALLAAVMTLGVLSGCGGSSAASTSSGSAAQSSQASEADPYAGLALFDTGTGLTIRMAEDLELQDGKEDPYYQNDSCAVRFLAEDFASFEALGYSRELTLEEYAGLIRQAYGLEGEVLSDSYGNVYITYAQEIQGIDFTYYNFYAKGSDAFWTLNYICPTELVEEMEPQFQLWTSSVQVS